MLKKTWKYLTAAVVVALVAMLVLALMPAGVNITEKGFLSVGTNVALAVNNPPTSEITDQRYQAGDVETLRPNAAGDLTELEASSGNNYECVNEADADGDESFVYICGGVVFGADLYNIVDHSEGSGTINKITVYFCCRYILSEGYAYAVIKSNSTTWSGSQKILSGSWVLYSQEWATNPADDEAWSWDDIDALQIGAELENGDNFDEESQCTQVYVEVDYTAAADISNAPGSKDFGTVSESTSYWSNGSAPTFPLDDGECFFTVTNNSSDPVNISIEAADFGGGVGWTIAGSPDVDTVTLKAGKSGDNAEGDMVTLTNSDQGFISDLAASDSIKWEIKLETGTFTDGVQKTSTITLTATFA